MACLDPLKAKKKVLVAGRVEGENQKYCKDQVKILKFMFKSLSSHDLDLTLPS